MKTKILELIRKEKKIPVPEIFAKLYPKENKLFDQVYNIVEELENEKMIFISREKCTSSHWIAFMGEGK